MAKWEVGQLIGGEIIQHEVDADRYAMRIKGDIAVIDFWNESPKTGQLEAGSFAYAVYVKEHDGHF
jgi:hypothetical protein